MVGYRGILSVKWIWHNRKSYTSERQQATKFKKRIKNVKLMFSFLGVHLAFFKPFISKVRCCAVACSKPNYPWRMLDKFLTRTKKCRNRSLRVCHLHFLPHSNPALYHVWGCSGKINPQHADELLKFYSMMYENRVSREWRLAPVEPRPPLTELPVTPFTMSIPPCLKLPVRGRARSHYVS